MSQPELYPGELAPFPYTLKWEPRITNDHWCTLLRQNHDMSDVKVELVRDPPNEFFQRKVIGKNITCSCGKTIYVPME